MTETDTDKVAEIFMKSLERLKWDTQFVQEFNEILWRLIVFFFFLWATNHPYHIWIQESFQAFVPVPMPD